MHRETGQGELPYWKRWKLRNPEKVKEQKRAYYQRHKEEITEKKKQRFKQYRDELCPKLIGDQCFICGSKVLLEYHEKNNNRHRKDIQYVYAHHKDFVRLCIGCHKWVTWGYRILGLTWEDVLEIVERAKARGVGGVKSMLRPYQKSCTKLNETEAQCEEGKITQQTCNNQHPLVFAWLSAKNGKDRWVLVCLECGYYEELP